MHAKISDTIYCSPRYEPNFVYLFGYENMDVDGAIDIDSGESIFILTKKMKDNYIWEKKLTKTEALNLYGV